MLEQDILNRDQIRAKKSNGSSCDSDLASAVIMQAFQDCRRLYRASGIDGLKGSEPYISIAYPAETMRFWCDAGNIDADAMAERFRNAMRSEKTAEIMFNNLGGWPSGTARNV